jgi:hypothetical protein
MLQFKELGKLVKLSRLRATNQKDGVMSQTDLALKLGYKSGQFVSNMERGLCSIPSRKINILSEELKLDKAKIIQAMLADYKNNLINGADYEINSTSKINS